MDKTYDAIDDLKREFSKKEKKYQQTISELKTENKVLKVEILRLRANNQKDSSNSSKPSSTDGYKVLLLIDATRTI